MMKRKPQMPQRKGKEMVLLLVFFITYLQIPLEKMTVKKTLYS